MTTDEQRLSKIEVLLDTLLVQQKTLIIELQAYNKEFQLHLQNTAVFTDRLHRVETGISKHSEELYGQGQIVHKVQRLEEKDTTINKVLWEIAKPILGMIGVGLIILLGMFAIMFYSMQQLVLLIAPSIP
jgi:hypothetical protein